MTAPNDKRSLPYGGAFSIKDTGIVEYIKSFSLYNCLENDSITKDFCNCYLAWISSTKNNSVRGLEKFSHAVYSNGTTQSFEMFYIKNKNRRFRCFKGEYVYHQLAWRNNWPNWKFIEDNNLDRNDAVIISLPFSDTGNKHEKMDWLLEQCNRLEIPVLVDCAYFGTCSGIDFNFNHECITDLVFSLSKTFPVAHARIGLRLTRVDDDDLMFVYDKINYNNRIGAKLGLDLIRSYSADYIYDKYSNQQKIKCKELDIVPSDTVLFGIDYEDRYPEYNRGSSTNRLGLYKHYEV